MTSRLILHAVDVAEARRILAREPAAADRWAADYPFEGDLAALGAFLRAPGEQGPFGYYQIVRRSDGAAIGGIGFQGPPSKGVVEIGYGLVPSARGKRYMGEAIVALMDIARGLGVTLVRADTDPDNEPSRRVLERAGFEQVAAGDLLHYEIRLR